MDFEWWEIDKGWSSGVDRGVSSICNVNLEKDRSSWTASLFANLNWHGRLPITTNLPKKNNWVSHLSNYLFPPYES